jgi:hypothetical protein
MPHKSEYLARKEREYLRMITNILHHSWKISYVKVGIKTNVSKTSSASTIRRESTFLSLVSSPTFVWSILWENSCAFIRYKNFKPKTLMKLEWKIDGFWTDSHFCGYTQHSAQPIIKPPINPNMVTVFPSQQM